MLDLVGPWPTTCTTSGSLTNASMIGCGVLAADEDVDVLGRLAAAAEAAAQLGADDAGHRADLLEQREPERQRLVDADAVADLCRGSAMPFEDLLLRLGAEALELGDLARARTPPSASSMVSIPSVSWSAFTFFGPSPGSRSICDQPRRESTRAAPRGTAAGRS